MLPPPVLILLIALTTENFNVTYYDTLFMDDFEYYLDPPDRCPVCNKDLSEYSREHRRKHIARCKRTKPKYFYSEAPRGRPSIKKHIKSPCCFCRISLIFAVSFLIFELILHFP